MSQIQRIAITAGEPAGIGPDLCIQLSQEKQFCQLVIIASPKLLMERARQLKTHIVIELFDPEKPSQLSKAGTMTVLPTSLENPVCCGQLDIANSSYVIETIKIAVKGCIDGLFDAMVTAPVNKAVINDAGFAFSGHTEFIADITGGHPVMMLATTGLRVALATTHIPLSEVSHAITAESLTRVISILSNELQERFSLENPLILVCGLNPHAGEGGHLGTEEMDIIKPVLMTLTEKGINLKGPLPADTLFTPKYLQTADAVLAMYHDQGLPVLKHMGFGQAVNITLGLPIIRTSVDHGTALDLAGTGKASLGSLKLAVNTAQDMAESNRLNRLYNGA